MKDSVEDFYDGKNVFITGVTGFVGKALVEKLLRQTNVNKIYVLVREKGGRSAKIRIEEIKKNAVFEKVKRDKGISILKKIIPVSGDVGMDSLGLSQADKSVLIDNVHVVIHSAATLDFESSAKQVININLMGTKRILSFCTEIQNLKVFVYVSTVYVNTDKDYAMEKLYEKPGNIDDYVYLLKLTDEEANEAFNKTLANNHVNAYTASKAIAEHEVNAYALNFPTAIVRPSMIVGAWREPIPGWTDSKNGPSGFFMGAGMGIIRRLPVDRNLIYDYIPVDIVVNHLIVAGWYSDAVRSKESHIYHCASSTIKPFSWKLIDSKIQDMLLNYPLKSAVWYPTVKLHKNFTFFKISSFFFHFLPGIIFDSLLKLSGKKPKLFRLHCRVNNSLSRLAPFIFKEWFFDSTNAITLHKSLTETDRVVFNISIKNINYEDFFENAVIGVRRYLNKESDDTLDIARKKVKIFYFLNILIITVFFYSFWYIMTNVCEINFFVSSWILLFTYFFFSLL